MKQRLTIDKKASIIIVSVVMILLTTTIAFLFTTKSLSGSLGQVEHNANRLESLSRLQLLARSATYPAQSALLTGSTTDYAEFLAICDEFERKLNGPVTAAFAQDEQANSVIVAVGKEFKEFRQSVVESYKSRSRSDGAVTGTGSRRGAGKMWLQTGSNVAVNKAITAQADLLVAQVGKLYALALNDISTNVGNSTRIGQQITIMQVFVILIAVIIGIFAPIYMIRFVVEPIRDSFKVIKQLASGLNNASHDLSSNSTLMADNVGEVGIAISQMASASSAEAQSASELAGLTEQINSSVQLAAEGSTKQAVHVSQAIEELDDLTRAIDHIRSYADDVSDVAGRSSDTAQAGQQAVQDTISGMTKIRETVMESAQRLQALETKAKQISDISRLIDDIAEQTNLLALNAAIEAARAGESGKGFAVVADEVRKLAERSANANAEIAGLIAGIQDETINAVSVMEQGTAEVEIGVNLAANAGSAIVDMMSSIDDVISTINQVIDTSKSMVSASANVSEVVTEIATIADSNADTTDKVRNSVTHATLGIESIAAISEETTASVQQIAANVEEQTESIQMIAVSASELSKMSSRLDELVGLFKL